MSDLARFARFFGDILGLRLEPFQVEIVKEVEKRLGPLAELQELTKTTDERMTSLNALAEHVGQKIKALENQKHTVEHAVVESNRLN